VFFRAETFGAAIAMLRAMAGLGAAMPTPYTPAWYLTPEVAVALAAGAIGSTPLLPQLQRWRAAADTGPRAAGTWEFAATAALMLVLVGAIAQSASTTYNPFIYFRF